jgi:hypothetical protein
MIYFIYLLSYLVLSISGNENKTINKLTVNISYGLNNTFILYYNLTTNHSYYLTFRLFENKQIKFGLFPPTYRYQQNSMKIPNRYNASAESFYLFIICFYFLRQSNDIDIQCKDIRLLKTNQNKSQKEFLPSYKPLFVPMMYLLNIIMLLPVIIQHRRRRQILLIETRKQLRRLSLAIAQDNPNILSRNLNLKTIPIQIELVSLSTKKKLLDVIDDNDNVTFTLQKLPPFINEESDFTADDCIAHLLNSAPWTSSSIHHPPMICSNSAELFSELHIPMMTKVYGDNDDDDQQSNLESNPHYKLPLFNSNPAFIESDV